MPWCYIAFINCAESSENDRDVRIKIRMAENKNNLVLLFNLLRYRDFERDLKFKRILPIWHNKDENYKNNI